MSLLDVGPSSTAGAGGDLRPLGAPPIETPAPAGSPRPSLVLLGFLAIVLLAALAMFARWAWRARLHAPYGDDHDWMDRALRQGPTLTADYLLQPHNAQHIVWARLLAWLGRNGNETSVFLGAGVGICVVAAIALVALGTRLSTGRRFGAALGVVAALVATETVAVQDAAWPVFSVYVFVTAFALLAFGLFEMRERGRLASPALMAALACAVASGFGNAAGLAVWPVLGWSAARSGERGKVMAAVILVGLAACTFGLEGATTAQSAAATTQGLDRVLKMAAYFGGYCALPWSAGTPRPVLQAAGWAFALAGAGLLLVRPQDAGRRADLAEFGRALIAFALITAVMATLGRVDELPQPIVPGRYVVFADLLHVGLLFACAPWIARAWARRPRAAEGAVALACLLLLVQQAAFGRKMVKAADRLHAASDAFDRGDRSAAVVALVYPPDPDRAARIRQAMRQAH